MDQERSDPAHGTPGHHAGTSRRQSSHSQDNTDGCASNVPVVGELEALRHAAEIVDLERSRAELRGDLHAASRLGFLRDRVLDEDAYMQGVDRGLAIVRRRELPDGATLGYLLACCPITRARRLQLGVHVPPAGIPMTKAELGEAA